MLARNLSAVLIGQPSTSFRFRSADWLLLCAMRMKAKILSVAVAVFRDESFSVFRVQELCESRGGRPGLSVLMSLMVSVDVKPGTLLAVENNMDLWKTPSVTAGPTASRVCFPFLHLTTRAHYRA